MCIECVNVGKGIIVCLWVVVKVFSNIFFICVVFVCKIGIGNFELILIFCFVELDNVVFVNCGNLVVRLIFIVLVVLVIKLIGSLGLMIIVICIWFVIVMFFC